MYELSSIIHSVNKVSRQFDSPFETFYFTEEMNMTKYQFFCIPDSDRKHYTYLDMASDSFIKEKAALLQQGFEVEDDAIYADTPKEAVEKFNSNFIYAVDEYGKADAGYSVAIFFQSIYKMIFGKKVS